MVIGGLFAFSGAKAISAIFSILCTMILGMIMTAFLCLLFDAEWDSDLGVALSTSSVVLAIPFVPLAIRFADDYAVPVIAGFCMASVSEIVCGIFNINDDTFYWKSSIELIGFVVAFLIAQKC